ncbi:MAG: AAA family ATPase [Eubacteriales bacterium]|nr:AAA family ATPase [Eubacteriales bacterium]
MNIKRAKQEIKDTIAAYLLKDEYGSYVIPAIRQRPILLIGPPGVGKTQIMEQISQECQIGLVSYTITHHTRQSAIGLPFIEHKMFGGREYAVTEYTMSEIVAAVYEKIEQTGMSEGILFIDEINCVSETLAPTMLQFLQGKTFGNHKIPEGWIIVAAGNPPEYNKSVREFDIVTLDRIRSIQVEPDFGAWKEYAVQVGIHPAIQSYLNIRRQHFCQIETTVDGKLFATPRGWEDLSQLIGVYETLGQKVDRDVAMEYIQFPKIARDFANYLELYYKYQNDYQVEEILAGRPVTGVYEKLEKAAFDERISVVGLLLSGLQEKFREVCRMEDMLELRMKKLRELHGMGVFGDAGMTSDSATVASAIQTFSDMLEDFQEEQGRKQESGLLSRLELRRMREVTARLEQDLQTIRKEDFSDAAAVWDRLRELFAADSDQYEDLVDEAGEMLEHAFDFMEAAFGGSQEMVLFVTELNTGFYSVHFLQDYECERYYRYNKELLFSDEEQEIGRILDQVR